MSKLYAVNMDPGLQHHKYIDKKFINGKWQYIYEKTTDHIPTVKKERDKERQSEINRLNEESKQHMDRAWDGSYKSKDLHDKVKQYQTGKTLNADEREAYIKAINDERRNKKIISEEIAKSRSLDNKRGKLQDKIRGNYNGKRLSSYYQWAEQLRDEYARQKRDWHMPSFHVKAKK